MSYIHFNPNPLNKYIGDCVVRAFCAALDISWEDAYTRIAARGYIMRDMPSSNSVWDCQLMHEGFKREILPFKDDYTVKDFCRDFPIGTYVLGTGTHAVTVKDGNYLDAWDSGDEIPTYYYRKELS